MTAACWLGVLVAVLAAPAAAQGSTITLEVRNEPGYKGPAYVQAAAHVVAGSGEANAIAARFEAGSLIVDDAAGVQAGAGCVVSTLNQARCAVPPGAGVRADVDTGDGDDAVWLADGLAGTVGGEGNDEIATDGQGRLFGGPGLDTIRAGAGADLVDPGPGRDQVQSLGGADRLLLRDSDHDDASCGRSGSAVADGTDLVLRCTRITRSGAGRVTLSTYPAWFSGRSVGVHLLCSRDLRMGCSGRITVRVGERLAGRGRFVLPADGDRAAPVALRRFARRRVLDAGRLHIVVRVDTRDARGHPIVLRAHATAYKA